jgi:Flp pilus assembly CpaF family ATPase
MRISYSRQGETQVHVFETPDWRVSIGRHADNGIVLKSPFVAERVAILSFSGDGYELTALGDTDVLVGRQLLHPGERVLVAPKQPIEIFPYSLSIDGVIADAVTEEQLREQLDRESSQMILDVHRDLLSKMDTSSPIESRGNNETYLRTLEEDLEEIARLQGLFNPDRNILLMHFAANTVLGETIAGIVETAGQGAEAWKSSGRWLCMLTEVPEQEGLLRSAIAQLSHQLGLPAIDDISRKIETVEAGFWRNWRKLAEDLYPETIRYLGLRYLKKQIKDIVFGYGPLEELLRMPNITEIMVVDRDKIYIEKHGVLEKSGRRFVSDSVTESIIERIVSRVGRRIDKAQPLVDARLKDGSRVNAVIPPLALNGPCLTIRKFPLHRLCVDDLIARKSLTPTVAEFLRAAVAARCNVLVSGGTGSGKTTLLNCLSNFIPDKERIVTIEDTAELQLQKEHVVRLETKSANVEGAGEYTIRDLVRNALRMRPDRIIVGECRGGEALDMLQAMNTGHDGSMTTVHANSADDVILRLEVLVQMAADLPIHSIHRQIASAVDLIVQLTRLRDGSRRVTQVTEVIDYDHREGLIRTKDLFRLSGDESDPLLMPTGSLPTFLDKLIAKQLINLDAFYV